MTTYDVFGLTCEHCAAAVSEELSALDGVDAVHVDLVPGGISRVSVDSRLPLEDRAVAAALSEAGDYTLA